MKPLFFSAAFAAAVAAVPSFAQDLTNATTDAGWRFNAGADLRIRQEMMDNIPGNPGDIYSVSTAKRGKNKNQLRIRPRVWFEAGKGPFRIYTRVTDEFREFFVENGQRRKDRSYTFPDELFLDNLFLEGRGLEPGWLGFAGVETVDFRFGRQDMLEGGRSIFGLDRLMDDGTPLDGSRSFFSDMVRAKFHFSDTRTLDVFALYDNGRNDLRWGNRQSDGRPLNPINMSDSADLDEWGGGLVFSDAFFDGGVPFKVYSIFKRTEAYTTRSPVGRRMPAKEVTTLGVLVEPRFNDNWGMELDGAKQFGRILSGNRQAGGFMGHVGLNYFPEFKKEWKPKVSLAATYYSGDRHRTGADDNDTAWDPMWARFTQDSEMLVYGGLYGNCWWSNMIYTKLKLSMDFGPRHGMYAYTGPMFAAVQDNLGHADGPGKSMFKGWLTAARYDFPIRLAPKGASGWDRFEMFAHIVAEAFQPGDYFDSGKPAYFVRWELDFRF